MSSVLEQRWELRPDLKRGVFNLFPYRPVYGLVHGISDPNERPGSPTRSLGSSPAVELDRVEAKMQLSFKTKVAQNVLGSTADLWFGYSQVSYRNSRPGGFHRRFERPITSPKRYWCSRCTDESLSCSAAHDSRV